MERLEIARSWREVADAGKPGGTPDDVNKPNLSVGDEGAENAPERNEAAHRNHDIWAAAAFVAGRFAAKEAAIKAHSHRRLTFHDVIIEKRGRDTEYLGSGPPVARIKGETEEDDDVSAMISISHDGDYATAICMAYDPSVIELQDGVKDEDGELD
ncbi:hypothetical protein PT974_00701 [Cladobotryum mycophilum]|uniref:4'-phosphopantetheinyl transferase domain-containing protein n=1 Tax=Cladobotryum mycophilum TaxID=491253 RepID=A0ABR0T1P3_9HYPO